MNQTLYWSEHITLLTYATCISLFVAFVSVVTLVITLKKMIREEQMTRNAMMITNFSNMCVALNNLREQRLKYPELEAVLFESRKTMPHSEVQRHVYGVQLANILEWTLMAKKLKLIDDDEWKNWETMWRKVILGDPSMRDLMLKAEIYSFSKGVPDFVRQIAS